MVKSWSGARPGFSCVHHMSIAVQKAVGPALYHDSRWGSDTDEASAAGVSEDSDQASLVQLQLPELACCVECPPIKCS